MHKPSKPIFTEHRRKRLTLWALTVLGWLLDVLTGQRELGVRQLNQRFHHLCFEDLTRVTIALVCGRALQFAKVRPRGLSRWKHGRDLRPTGFMRSLLGYRFRRALKHRDIKPASPSSSPCYAISTRTRTASPSASAKCAASSR